MTRDKPYCRGAHGAVYYFLRRPGTTVLALQQDHRPVMVREDKLIDALAFYERFVPLSSVGPLEAVRVEEHMEQTHGLVARITADINKRVHARADKDLPVRPWS